MEKCVEPQALEPCNEKQVDCGNSCEYLFESKEDMNRSLTRLCHGNLYVIGKIWVDALQSVLVGSNMSLLPVVEAAAKKEPPPPKKPPPMKYEDLSIYNSPHHEYKDYEEEKQKCPGRNEKILHNFLLPKVKKTRKEAVNKINDVKENINSEIKKCCNIVSTKKKEFKSFMRHPDNLFLRQAVVGTSAVVGFIVGRRLGTFKDSLTKGFFLSGLSVLASGALCFPKETDKYFRDACHYTAKVFLTMFNFYCKKNFQMKQKLPCDTDVPEKPKPKPKTKPQCPEKKK